MTPRVPLLTFVRRSRLLCQAKRRRRTRQCHLCSNNRIEQDCWRSFISWVSIFSSHILDTSKTPLSPRHERARRNVVWLRTTFSTMRPVVLEKGKWVTRAHVQMCPSVSYVEGMVTLPNTHQIAQWAHPFPRYGKGVRTAYVQILPAGIYHRDLPKTHNYSAPKRTPKFNKIGPAVRATASEFLWHLTRHVQCATVTESIHESIYGCQRVEEMGLPAKKTVCQSDAWFRKYTEIHASSKRSGTGSAVRTHIFPTKPQRLARLVITSVSCLKIICSVNTKLTTFQRGCDVTRPSVRWEARSAFWVI